MLAQDLREGAIHYRDGRPAILVLSDAEPVDHPLGPLVRVMVRFMADGGVESRYFEQDVEVPYEPKSPWVVGG